MRIAFYGNICNNLYQIAKALRRSCDFDAHLFLDEQADSQQLPESDDPALVDGYPEWIHRGPYRSVRTLLSPWTSPLVRELNRFDFAVVSSFGPIYAQFSSTPTAFLTSGSDLTVFPFPLRFQFQRTTWRERLGWSAVGLWQRRGVQRCAQVWTQPFRPFMEALERLGVAERSISSAYFPVVMDTGRFRFDPEARRSQLPAVRTLVASGAFIVFHPSRLMIDPHPRLKETGQWKGNDVLIEGFARFVRNAAPTGAVLALVERTVSGDVDAAKRIIRRLGIEDQVVWLKPPRGFGFLRDELRLLYSVADVVADDFGAGWFGSVALEGLATSRPVVTYVDDPVMRRLYPWHPFISANTESGIAAHLTALYRDADYRSRQGRLGRRFVETFHSPEAVGRLYTEQIRGLTSQHRAG